MGISPPLPAHSGLPAQHLQYGRTLPTTLLGPMSHVGVASSFPPQTSYKVPVGQPAFNLDSTTRAHAEQLSRYVVTPSVLGSLDKDCLVSTAGYSATTSTPVVTTESTSGWELSNFIPPISTQLTSQPSDTGVSGIGVREPPPAHSSVLRDTTSARPSSIQRTPNPYQTKAPAEMNIDLLRSTYSLEAQPQSYQNPRRDSPPKPVVAHPNAQPPVAHQHNRSSSSAGNRDYSSSEIRQALASVGTYHRTDRATGYSDTIRTSSRPVYDESPQNSSHASHRQNISSPLNVPQRVSQPLAPQRQSVYCYTTTNGTNSMTSTTYNTQSPIETTIAYDPVSPVHPSMEPTQQQQHQVVFNQAMSLEDLANLSSNREKIPVQPTHTSSPMQLNGQLQSSPPQLIPLQNLKQIQNPHLQLSPTVSMTSSHIQQQLGNVASPPQSMAPTTVNVQDPVRAIPDSTTKPKKSRKRKKKDPHPIPAVLNPPAATTYTTLDANAIHELSGSSLAMKQAVFSTQSMANAYNTPQPIMTTSGPDGAALALVSSANLYQNFDAEHFTLGMSVPAMVEPGEIPSDTVFMTNTSGNAFVNPNDVLGGQVPPEEPDLSAQYMPLSTSGVLPVTVDYQYQKKPDPKSIREEELDDEFGHLKTAPVEKKPPPSPTFLPKSKPIRQMNPVTNNEVNGNAHCNPQGNNNPGDPLINPHGGRNPHDGGADSQGNPSQNPSPGQTKPGASTGKSGFMGSFLSFLQGNKGETLSSVTNSTVTKKPELPKYIPDPRPRRVVPSPPEKSEKLLKKSAPTVISFSSDEDDDVLPLPSTSTSKTIKRKIQHALTTLDEGKAGASVKRPPIKLVLPIPQSMRPKHLQSKQPQAKQSQAKLVAAQNRPREKTTPRRPRTKSKPLKEGKKKSRRLESSDEEDVGGMDMEVEVIDDDKEDFQEVVAANDDTPFTPVRERSSRKAKEKVEEKRKKRLASKCNRDLVNIFSLKYAHFT